MIDDDTDDIDGRDAAEKSEGNKSVNANKAYDVHKVSNVVSADSLATEHTVFIYPIGSGVALAKYKFEYEWSSDGASFTVVGKQYLSRRSGLANCRFSLRVDSDDNWIPVSEENARQDDAWHSFPYVHTVRSNASEELVRVRVVYWEGNNRMDMNNYLIASYSRQSPSITSPGRDDDVLPNLEVSGTATSGAWVAVYEGHTARQLSDWVESGFAWRTRLREPLTPGLKVLTARQQHRGVLSGWADNISVTVLPKPSISSPISGSDIEHRRPEISGTGLPTAEVQLHVSHSAVEIPHPVCIVDSQRRWRTMPHNDLPLGEFEFTARQTSAGMYSAWADDVSVVIELPVPVITGPVAASVQDRTFTVTGNNGRSGAIVQVWRGLTDNKVGETGTLTGASWSCPVTVPAGNISLTAHQIIGGDPSNRSVARAFRVRPPKLTDIIVTQPTPTSVKFEGAGYANATVQISVVNGPGGGAPPAAPVSGGRWETTVTNWSFGLHNLSAIQKVSDDAGGWIESQPYTFNVDLKLPGPSDVIYTAVYQPTFSGKGLNGATVRLFDAIDDSKIAPDAPVTGGEWDTRALAEWGPTFKRKVKVLQFWGEQASPDAIEIEVTIPPLAPVMNPPVENGLSPNLSGTCWPEAELTLTFSDSAIEHIVENHNGSWSFRRDEPFAPEITHTASLTQFAAQQTSLPATKTFVVALPMRKPVLTYPEPNGEVGRNVTIRGRDGMAGATMQLRDAQFERPLGQAKLLTTDGEWFIELADLAFRRYTIDAQQTLEGRPSEYSEHLAFDVVLLPPEFDEPQPGGSLPRTSQLSGRGMGSGLVDVWLQGASEPLLKDVFIDSDGRWKAEVTLPVGETTIRAVQRFEDQISKESPWLTYDVVPAAPFIETPATDEHIGRRVVVSGFGVPGDSVTVKLGDAGRTVLGSSPVLEDRTWSLTVTFDQPGGAFGLMAVASSEGFDSADSPARAVVLGTYQSSIEMPAAGRWVSNPVRFEGQGRAGIGHVVSWFNPDRVWVPDLNVASGGWHGAAPQALPDGGNWCRFRQSITDAVDGATTSDWVESERFEILAPPARLTVDAR